MVKILHCADLHLGSPFKELGRKSKTRSKDIQNTFINIINICKKENVKLLLIAGDLFDDIKIDEELLLLVRDELASIANTEVGISPGNHDPLTLDSPYARNNFWSDNVHIFSDTFQSVELNNIGVRLCGAGFIGTYAHEPIFTHVPVNDELINICVLHGMLVSNGQGCEYNPITKSKIAESQMAYIALGHIHKNSEIMRADNTFYGYCGCPEGRGFDELGSKGVYLGNVSKGFCDLEFIPINKRTYIELKIDITNVTNYQEIIKLITYSMLQKFGENYRENLYKIILNGTVSETLNIDCENITNELMNEVFYIKLRDKTDLLINTEDLESTLTLKSEFIRKMKAPHNNDTYTQELAFKLGIKAFNRGVIYDED